MDLVVFEDFLSRLCGGEVTGVGADVRGVFLSRLCGGEVKQHKAKC